MSRYCGHVAGCNEQASTPMQHEAGEQAVKLRIISLRGESQITADTPLQRYGTTESIKFQQR